MGGLINGAEAFEGETEKWMGLDFPTAVVGQRSYIDLDPVRRVPDLYIVPDVGLLGRLIWKLISQPDVNPFCSRELL